MAASTPFMMDHEVSEAEERVSRTVEQQGKPFSDHVSQVLESFYKSGMVGWGERHNDNFADAVHITGLSASQVQVRKTGQNNR